MLVVGFSKTGPKWVERGSLRSRRSRLWPFRAQMRCGGCASGTGTPGEGAIVGWGWGPRMAPMTSKLLQMLIFSFWFPLNATKLGNCSLQNQSHTHNCLALSRVTPTGDLSLGLPPPHSTQPEKGYPRKKTRPSYVLLPRPITWRVKPCKEFSS